jgi:hypothetical protein
MALLSISDCVGLATDRDETDYGSARETDFIAFPVIAQP